MWHVPYYPRNLKFLQLIFISLTYAYLISYSDLLFGYSFDAVKDRSNYKVYIDSGISLLLGKDGLDFVLKEPVFIFFMTVLSAIFDSSVTGVRALIYISSFIFSFSILKVDRISWGGKFLILVFPSVLVNYIMTLRQGLALSFFMYAYLHGSRRFKVVVYSILPLIHYLFWIVIGVVITRMFIDSRRWSVGLVSVCVVSVASLLLFILVFFISNYDIFSAGELRALLSNYIDKLHFRIGFGWIFWFLFLLVFVSYRVSFIKGNSLSLFFLVLYLIWVPFFPPVSRFMQVGSPVILSAALGRGGLTGVRRILLLLMVCLHIFYFWMLSFKCGGPGGMVS